MKKVVITIDGVIRDLFPKLEFVYNKYILEKEENDEGYCKVDSYDFNKLNFKSFDELYNFLFEEYSLVIFGTANEFLNSMEHVNNLCNKNKDIEFILSSREFGKAIPATLFFLSKLSCKVKNIKFVKTYDEIAELGDIVITDNPIILKKYKNKSIQIGDKIKTNPLAKFDNIRELTTDELNKIIKKD